MLYLAGGLAASASHVAWTSYTSHRRSPWSTRGFLQQDRGALGASGSVQAIGVASILMYPTRTILMYGLFPIPAALLGVLWLWNDLGGVLDHGHPGRVSSIAHAGHLGGAATGLLFYMAVRRGIFY